MNESDSRVTVPLLAHPVLCALLPGVVGLLACLGAAVWQTVMAVGWTPLVVIWESMDVSESQLNSAIRWGLVRLWGYAIVGALIGLGLAWAANRSMRRHRDFLATYLVTTGRQRLSMQKGWLRAEWPTAVGYSFFLLFLLVGEFVDELALFFLTAFAMAAGIALTYRQRWEIYALAIAKLEPIQGSSNIAEIRRRRNRQARTLVIVIGSIAVIGFAFFVYKSFETQSTLVELNALYDEAAEFETRQQ